MKTDLSDAVTRVVVPTRRSLPASVVGTLLICKGEIPLALVKVKNTSRAAMLSSRLRSMATRTLRFLVALIPKALVKLLRDRRY